MGLKCRGAHFLRLHVAHTKIIPYTPFTNGGELVCVGNSPSLFISLTNYLDQAYSSEDSQCFSMNKTATVSPLASSSSLTNKNISL